MTFKNIQYNNIRQVGHFLYLAAKSTDKLHIYDGKASEIVMAAYFYIIQFSTHC